MTKKEEKETKKEKNYSSNASEKSENENSSRSSSSNSKGFELSDKKYNCKELEQKVKELEEGWRRTQADFENYRRRSEDQRAETINFIKADFMAKISPVLDNFRLAFSHVPENIKDDNWTKGIGQIEKQLKDLLAQEGLKKIDTTNAFDPNLHEAISYEENSEIPADQIIAEIESGWQFGDRVIKPAKVRVSKGK